MRSRATWLTLCLGLTVPVFGCKSQSSSSASAAAGASAQAPPVAPAPLATVQLPEGPSLAIQAGAGVGPIRIGATVATIERLMAAPCEMKTADVCRYIRRAVEFDLDKAGVTERIIIHRHDRPAGPDASGQPQVYGFFNGGIPPGVGLGMIPKAVIEILGKPLSSERVNEKNAFNTLDRDTYPGGMVLEYDEYKNGKVILGGVIITKPKQ